jgi:hypothetical protein
MDKRRNLQSFRIRLIYSAEGMTRPLTDTQVVPAESCSEALQLAINFIRSAYRSGFVVHSWTAENLSRPVELIYVNPGEGNRVRI